MGTRDRASKVLLHTAAEIAPSCQLNVFDSPGPACDDLKCPEDFRSTAAANVLVDTNVMREWEDIRLSNREQW